MERGEPHESMIESGPVYRSAVRPPPAAVLVQQSASPANDHAASSWIVSAVRAHQEHTLTTVDMKEALNRSGFSGSEP
jgi:hypothetical protein